MCKAKYSTWPKFSPQMLAPAAAVLLLFSSSLPLLIDFKKRKCQDKIAVFERLNGEINSGFAVLRNRG